MGHSFKLEENQANSNKSKTDYSFLFMIFFIFIAIVCMIVYFAIQKNSSVSVKKQYNSKEYVYTVKKVKNENTESDEIVYEKIPAINLEGDIYDELNKRIIDNYNYILKRGPHDYKYKFSVSKNILSLVISSSYYDEDNTDKTDYQLSSTHFYTYNISLETGDLLTNSDLLKKFGITKKQVETYMEAKFTGYYNDLIKLGYFKESECDYKCYLKNRGISTSYSDGGKYYVDNGKLMLYKFYYKDSKYDEAQYFYDIPYKFLLKK